MKNINADIQQYQILSCPKGDRRFPTALRELQGMPQMLYYKGNIEVINQRKNIAIVGSRESSEKGRNLSYDAGRMGADAGMSGVNGLALGCDTAAIKGALSVGGKCIVIMPCGLDQIVPKSNESLADEILRNGGCILSEYPQGAVLQKYQYIQRDRLQSGISQAVLVVETEEKSGTMHTVDFAMRQYKRLACYASKILELSSGNRCMEKNKNIVVLQSETDTQEFLKTVLEEPRYEQLALRL